MANKERRHLYNKLHKYLPARLTREILTAAQYNWDYLLKALKESRSLEVKGKACISYDPYDEEVYTVGDYIIYKDGIAMFSLHYNSLYGTYIEDIKQ